MSTRLLLCLLILSSLMFSGCFIKGRIVDENGAGLAGVTVILSGAASGVSTTNRLGYYQFGSFSDKLPAGSYTVTPSGNTTPASKDVTLTLRNSGVANPVNKVDFSKESEDSYTDNGDGTVLDNVTGLMWQQSPDTDGDGDIDAADKLAYDEAVAGASTLTLAGYTDWRLPTIKELYSLIDFSGRDPSGYAGTDTSGLIPFIDTAYFDFAYGDTGAGERIIDSQYASSSMYVDGELLFGVNFADGRIKGYGLQMPFGPGEKTFFVTYVRGNTEYEINDFIDNGDGTITDSATDLMWTQDDSGEGLNWEAALAWVEEKNAETYLGYSDWRLPNAKELQSIVDYTRSPGTTSSAAIDPLFNATAITNEALEEDYPCYWSSTTHADWTATSGANAVYIAFGRAMGYMNGVWVDVHGAGTQRSDPKAGDPDDFPTGRGPQGDAIRIYNYVRLVRDSNFPDDGDNSGYAIVDTGQIVCYDDSDELIACPAESEPFYGQDAQHTGNVASYSAGTYSLSDTGQAACYDDNGYEISCPESD